LYHCIPAHQSDALFRLSINEVSFPVYSVIRGELGAV